MSKLEAFLLKRQLQVNKIESLYVVSKKVVENKEYLNEFKARYLEIDNIKDLFEDNHISIQLVKDKDFNFEEHERIYERFSSLFYRIKSTFILITDNNGKDPETRSLKINSVKLPKLSLCKFNGDYLKWINFISLFKSVIHVNSELSNVEKLNYLLGCLFDEPLNLIKHLPLSEDNYDIALDLLQKRYENKRLIADYHLERILKLQCHSLSNETLRNFINVVKEDLNALQVLNFPVKQWSFLLLHILLRKLDSNIRTKFELQVKSDVMPTCDELVEFLEHLCNASEMSQHGIQIKQQQSNKVGKIALISSRTTNIGSCSCCNKANHTIFRCEQFSSMNVAGRRKIAFKGGLCYNCLGSGHRVEKCKSSRGCNVCGGRHHTLLHFDNGMNSSSAVTTQSETNNQGDSEVSNISSLSSSADFPNVMLATAIVNIRDKEGNFHQVRSLLDSGSQSTFISKECVQRLGLTYSSKVKLPVSGIGNTITGTLGVVDCVIRGTTDNRNLCTKAIILNNVTGVIPNRKLKINLTKIKGLTLADPTFNNPGTIDLLLGADVYGEVMTGKCRRLGPNLPIAYDTIFGWVLLGKVKDSNLPVISTHLSYLSPIDKLDDTLKRFWEQEEVPSESSTVSNPDDVICEKHFTSTHSRSTDGRFIVKLPFKKDVPSLGESRSMALSRFLSLERRLNRDTSMKVAYSQFLMDYLKLGHMSLSTEPINNSLPCYYIPHHGIVKEASSTTKLRVVFDASMKDSSGISLNEILHTGPKLQLDIVDIILHFRLHPIVFTCDIKQMYRQIMIHPQDRHYQMILWRESTHSPVEEYTLNTVTYGMAPSPYLAMRALRQLAYEGQSRYPLAAKALCEDIFVDDIITGAASMSEARVLRQQLVELLKEGQFELRKWSSNTKEFLLDIPVDHCEKPLRFDSDNLNIIKILGLYWDSESDMFSYFTALSETSYTKRSILSNIARIFDPCGWLAPVTFKAKSIMQELWTLGVGWDDRLPISMLSKWEKFVREFSSLSHLRIPRWILSSNPTNCQLHGFSDASEIGYAAVVYLRTCDVNNGIRIIPLIAKSRVAPIKQKLTIPKLELSGAALLNKLLMYIAKSFKDKLTIELITGWSDSMIVLSWLSMSPHVLQTFEANRISQIKNSTIDIQWRHVPSEKNPADCASRGLFPSELVDHPLWWNPIWLSEPEDSWPTNPHELKSGDIPGIKSTQIVSNIHIQVDKSTLLFNYSNLDRLQRVTAWVIRFAHNCRNQEKRVTPYLTGNELQEALMVWVKVTQTDVFSKDIDLIKRGKMCSTGLQRLHPFIDEQGVLRVGGRLRHSTLNYTAKHPIILPHTHHLTNLIIDSFHGKLMHAGPNLLLSILRKQYWILSARRIIRHRVFLCKSCFRTKATAPTPYMGDLPSDRLCQTRPFLKVGCDFAGPFFIKASNLRKAKIVKCYLCIFVCFTTKAVHLEVVSDLSTDAFLAAFDRFTSRRGLCSDIYTDCGSNFKGCSRYLNDISKILHNSVSVNRINAHTQSNKVNWHFNPPASPHFGGLFEAAVKVAKTHLVRVIGDQSLTFEELSTVFTRIEAVLNSRPLCELSSDPDELDVLTPGHFIIGSSLVAVPEECLSDLPKNRLSRWQLVKQLTQHIWKRWSLEYLHTLQQRSKWTVNNYKMLKLETL
jgi:hypothetical protein